MPKRKIDFSDIPELSDEQLSNMRRIGRPPLGRAARTAGGHANTVRVDTEHATHHVDTGFIVFNDRNYPNFERLLASLGVASQPSDMSFGVSDGGDFEYNGSSPNGLFAKRAHLVTPWFHRMVADLVRCGERGVRGGEMHSTEVHRRASRRARDRETRAVSVNAVTARTPSPSLLVTATSAALMPL